MHSLRLGVVVDSEDKLYYLKAAALESGHEVVRTLVMDTATDTAPAETRVDAWVADLALAEGVQPVDAEAARILEETIDAVDVPVVFCDSSELADSPAERDIWRRQLKLRLRRLGGDVSLVHHKQAEFIWILAASTGGVGAVKEFLQHLPGQLGVGFLYAQHIDQGYSSVLANLVNKTGAYQAVLANTGSVIASDTVTVIDPVHRVEVLENATLLVHEEPWAGPYHPSINQLAANVARALRVPAGLIVFSGMGDDGVLGGRLIKQRRGRVWAQAPDTCVIASMPEAVIRSGCVDRVGTPRELAEALVTFVGTSLYSEGATGS